MDRQAIFVTGATSGIGLGIASRLARAGHRLAFNGIADAGRIKEIEATLVESGAAECRYYDGDMAKPDQVRDMMCRAEADLGRVDGLVNNAGIQFVAPIEDFPAAKWDEVIAVNLSASFHATAVVLPGMRKRGFGRIVNISSVHGLRASPNKSAYVAAKHGLIGLTRATAMEAATDGVTCNAICPGWVRTPLVEAQIEARMEEKGTDRDEEARSLVIERQPSGEFVSIEHLAELTEFLLTSEAGASFNGTALPVDGGWTAK